MHIPVHTYAHGYTYTWHGQAHTPYIHFRGEQFLKPKVPSSEQVVPGIVVSIPLYMLVASYTILWWVGTCRL